MTNIHDYVVAVCVGGAVGLLAGVSSAFAAWLFQTLFAVLVTALSVVGLVLVAALVVMICGARLRWSNMLGAFVWR